MTKKLEIAFEEARHLPPEEQDELARMILEVVHGAQQDVYVLSEEENAAIDLALEQVERGEYASEEEVTALFPKSRE